MGFLAVVLELITEEHINYVLVVVNGTLPKIVDGPLKEIAERSATYVKFSPNFVDTLNSAKGGLLHENFADIRSTGPALVDVKFRWFKIEEVAQESNVP